MVLEVSLITEEWTVFQCHKSGDNRHLRIAKNRDYFGAIVILDAVDAFITGQSGYLVTKHHDERRLKWWLECRLLNNPERVLWRTEACGWMTWFMGTGDTVWHTEWCGPGVKGKDWLIGRELVTGAEIYRKAEACRFMGLFCGPLIITASARSITAWEAVPLRMGMKPMGSALQRRDHDWGEWRVRRQRSPECNRARATVGKTLTQFRAEDPDKSAVARIRHRGLRKSC